MPVATQPTQPTQVNGEPADVGVRPSAVARILTAGSAVFAVVDSPFAHEEALTEHETVGL